MPLISVVITLAVVGFFLWLFETLVTMDATIKRWIHAIVLFAVAIWLLDVFGLLDYLKSVKTPRL